MDPVIWTQWISIAILFLLSSIWSEDNIRFGYILVPFMAGFFWLIGWIQFYYLSTIIPLIILMGVISYLRSQLKSKYGVFGSSGGLLFKIVSFVIILQMAIGFVNGMALFTGPYAATPSNEYTTYTLQKANDTYAGSSSGIDILDAITNGLSIAWMMFRILWSMISSIFLIYPLLVTSFHIPSNLSLLIQCGIYLLYGAELFTMIFKPYKPAEI